MSNNRPNKWLPYQRYRLALEREILKIHMPDFEFLTPRETPMSLATTPQAKAQPMACTSLFQMVFQMLARAATSRIPLPSWEKTWPLTLIKIRTTCTVGQQARKAGPRFVPLSQRPGPQNIPLLKKSFRKSFLWIEAYESHLTTGRHCALFTQYPPIKFIFIDKERSNGQTKNQSPKEAEERKPPQKPKKPTNPRQNQRKEREAH